MSFTPHFIRQLPKTDLHVHLDGSIRLATLIDIAQQEKIKLPSYHEEGLRELVFKNSYANLTDYLKGFEYTLKVLNKMEHIERCAYELATDAIADGAWYIEVRFAPQLHVIPGKLSMRDIFSALTQGLQRAAQEQNQKYAQNPQESHPFAFGIIACVMRFFKRSYSPYFAEFLGADPFSNAKQTHDAALLLAKEIVKIRDETAIPLVALDSAGAERDWHPDVFAEAFSYAQDHFLFATIHAGEDEGAQSIYRAVTMLHAQRIGHALHLFDASLLNLPSVTHKETFLERLASFMAKQGITIESCISSNLQTAPEYTLETHVTKELLHRQMPFSLCTDNRLISNTTLCKEYELLLSANTISRQTLKAIIMTGFKGSFFPGSYHEKQAFVAKAREKTEVLLSK